MFLCWSCLYNIKKKSECNWQKVKDGKQRVCCTFTERCHGKKCHQSKKKCTPIGLPRTRHYETSCKWTTVGPNKKKQKNVVILKYIVLEKNVLKINQNVLLWVI